MFLSRRLHFFVVSLLLPSPTLAAIAQTATATPTPTIASIDKAINTGRPDEALAAIATLRAAQPTTPGLDREQGLALYAEDKLPAANDAFAAALVQDPKDFAAAQMRGLTLFRLGRPADAIPLLEAGRQAGIVKTDPNYVLGLCYMDVRRYDDARAAFARQFGFAPDSAAAYLAAARMLLRREYLPIASQFADKAIELDPKLPLAHELLGELALAGGKLDVAIAELEKERQLNPIEGSVYDRLGDAYFRAGRFDEAQRVLEQDVLLEPHSTGPYILLGKVMLKKGDAVAAATFLEHARAMDPGNYMTHSLLGTAYRAEGRSVDASRETSEAQTLQAAAQPKIETLH